MTIQALAWATDQRVPGTAGLVLRALANRADHLTGHVEFDASAIAEEAVIREPSLWRYLGALERNGFLAKDDHNGAGKRDYWLQLDRDPSRPFAWAAGDGETGDDQVEASTQPIQGAAPTAPRSFRRDRQDKAREVATAPPPGKPDLVAVLDGSDAARAWIAHDRARGRVPPFTQAVITADGQTRRGFYKPTLFPPRGQVEGMEGVG